MSNAARMFTTRSRPVFTTDVRPMFTTDVRPVFTTHLKWGGVYHRPRWAREVRIKVAVKVWLVHSKLIKFVSVRSVRSVR